VDDAQPIELVGPPVPARPALPGAVVMRPDSDTAIDALLADLYLHARNCTRSFGDFHLAMALWPQVNPAVLRLLTDPRFRDFPWSRTRVWLVDEADVPEDHPERRSATLHGMIVEGSGMPPEQAHTINASDPAGAAAYEALLREHLGWREKGHDRLDFVLVPLLPDGAWGGVAMGHERGLMTRAEDDGPARVMMTQRLVRAARCIGVLAVGDGLAHAVSTWAGGDRTVPADVPACAELRWYLDHASLARPAGRAAT